MSYADFLKPEKQFNGSVEYFIHKAALDFDNGCDDPYKEVQQLLNLPTENALLCANAYIFSHFLAKEYTYEYAV